MSENFDVLIVGGGLVGASLACALHGSALRVGLIEAQSPKTDGHASYDERHLALARVSVDSLGALGVWRHVGALATAIEHVQVSRRGEFGNVRMTASDYGLAAFGAVLPARELGNGLSAQLQQCSALQRFCPARCLGFERHADRVEVDLDCAGTRQRLATRLLVGADGTESEIRAALGIASERHDYAQTAIVATVTPERAHQNRAFERFIDRGAVALLPLSERRAGIVWTLPSAEAERMRDLPDARFLDELQDAFGFRLGRLARLGRRSLYALKALKAHSLVAERAVLLGNAAQTLHPIAAQGFNLGLRDALTLAELLRAAEVHGGDAGAAALLDRYQQARAADREQTMGFSDTLVRVFGHPDLTWRALSSISLVTIERLAPLKSWLVRHGMGQRRGAAPAAVESVS